MKYIKVFRNHLMLLIHYGDATNLIEVYPINILITYSIKIAKVHSKEYSVNDKIIEHNI